MIQQPTYGPHHTDLLSPFQREGQQIYDQPIYDRLHITPQQLMEFCQKWQIAELAVFGSILRDDFRVGGDDPSDVDFLFSYLPDTNMSLFRRAKMKIEIEDLCRRSVDLMLITEVMQSHNVMRKKHILESAKLIYVYE